MDRIQFSVARRTPLDADIQRFFELAEHLELDTDEERALLDLPRTDVALLRRGGIAVTGSLAKLQRRVAYAIPIMQRMLAANAS